MDPTTAKLTRDVRGWIATLVSSAEIDPPYSPRLLWAIARYGREAAEKLEAHLHAQMNEFDKLSFPLEDFKETEHWLGERGIGPRGGCGL